MNTIVSTAWLADHLNDPDVRIVDATYHLPGTNRDAAAEFAEAHIPGAVFFDVDDIAAPESKAPGGLPHMLPPPELFAERMAALGIGNDSFVVCYDVHGLMSAARAWWMLRAFGHDGVAVLDGGLPAWKAEGRPLESGVPTPVPARFTAHVRPALVRSKAEVLAGTVGTVIDARARERFEGAAPEPRPGLRGGHIPGALNLPFGELLEPATKTLLPPERIAARFAAAGLPESGPVTASCGSGITACVLALGLHRIGREDAAVYDGSWAEWGMPGDTPVETGPARNRP
ncbi:3-mercaptopyruvate sulfurtransferase [Inquilinus limosus]|uniref:Sulfurtransferase n=1 Tax=Inquilinus limosus TaxID=171674 RepID=A0A211Z9Y2_9PROT|nr:3-mercaptopyruvate sulfurtransferase [Inquilinus limosus]OWJ62082.1 3-mercaptopyruvate sulfurtransferase [Inquilinus limosus]